MTKHNRILKRCIHVPIYNAKVWLIVDKDIIKERKKWEDHFGPAPEIENYVALCCRSGRATFALFFSKQALTREIIAHEVFHLTHRILEWASANFDPEHHEQGALLHGYLMEKICKELQSQT